MCFLVYLQIDGATVKTEEKSLVICLRSKSGVSVVVKTDNLMIKQVWANAFEAQIEVLANKVASAARSITAEEKALTFSLNGEYGIGGKTVVIPSVAVKEAESFNSKGSSSNESHPLTSPFNSTSGGTSPKAGGLRPGGPMSPSGANLNSSLFARHAEPSDGDADKLEFLGDDEDEEEEWKRNDDDDEDDESTDVDGKKRAKSKVGGIFPNFTISKNGSAESKAYRPKSLKFGIQPEFLVTYEDFGVAPELLTTAQKVAILESAAWQNQSKALQPHAPNKKRGSLTTDDPDYTPTGLRLHETDKQHTVIEGDGGAVAKTGDTLKSKINAWNGWSKEKEKAKDEKAAAVPAKASK
jgi:hypothetical protein